MTDTSRGTTAEQVNRAIVELDWRAGDPSVSAGVRRAIHDLAVHWTAFFRGGYWDLPDPLWTSRIGRYVQWYARAWALAPASVRAACRDPRTIDASFAALASDTIARLSDAYEGAPDAVREAARELAQDVESEARRMGRAAVRRGRAYVREAASSARLGAASWIVLIAGGVAVAALAMRRTSRRVAVVQALQRRVRR